MIKREFKTVKERLFWSYANLAMAHTAVEKNQEKYIKFNYMIRSKLYKGLCNNTMNVRTLFDDEKIKLLLGQKCSYCGSEENLALDHIFPKKYGGKDTGDNLIYACRKCNSSKGKKDLMEWMISKEQFPALLILRRYLKLVIEFCEKENYMNSPLEDLRKLELPFNIDFIPIDYPAPYLLNMTVK